MKKIIFSAIFCLLLSLKANATEFLESTTVEDISGGEIIQQLIDDRNDSLTFFGKVITGVGCRTLDMGKNIVLMCLGKLTGAAVARISEIFIKEPVSSLKWLALYYYIMLIPASYLFSNSISEALLRALYCIKDYILLNILFLNVLIDSHGNEFDLKEFFHIEHYQRDAHILTLAKMVKHKVARILDIGVRFGHGNKVLVSLSSRDQRKVYIATLALLLARELADFGYYLMPIQA